jgi:pimeloyl-ACP methyl ester carboxylesterase
MSDVVRNPQFNKSLPTVVYIHGYLGDGEFDESVMAVRSAYRNRNNQNFIAIDWSAFSHFTSSIPYLGNIEKLKLVSIFLKIKILL